MPHARQRLSMNATKNTRRPDVRNSIEHHDVIGSVVGEIGIQALVPACDNHRQVETRVAPEERYEGSIDLLAVLEKQGRRLRARVLVDDIEMLGGSRFQAARSSGHRGTERKKYCNDQKERQTESVLSHLFAEAPSSCPTPQPYAEGQEPP